MNCPVCGSADCSLEMRVTAREAALHYLADPQSERFSQLQRSIEELWQQDHNDLSLCQHCGFGFAWPYVAGNAKFYGLAYERADYPAEKWDFDRALESIDRHAITPNRVLEIGAGFGLFLDKLMAHHEGKPVVVATEYGLPALQQLRAKGYDARDTDVRDLDDVEPFDLICGFQVLEHLGELDRLADTLERLLKPGGYAMFAVPDIATLSFNARHQSMLDMPPNHIGRWTREAFAMFGRKCGLELVEFDTEPHRIAEFIKMDIAYSYLRKSQRPGTMANWSRRKRSTRFGKLVGVGMALALAPLRIPGWFEAARRTDLGGSSFALFRKPLETEAKGIAA